MIGGAVSPAQRRRDCRLIWDARFEHD